MAALKKSNLLLPSDSLLPIRTVARLTGVNPVTLRAWERRYNLLQPTRTPKGQRLYNLADVEFIKQVQELLKSGIAIGQISNILPRDQCRPNISSRGDFWHQQQLDFLQAIHHFDHYRLEQLYQSLLALYPVDTVTSNLLIPLLHELGWRWQCSCVDVSSMSTTPIAEEHFFSMFLRNKLSARLHHAHHPQTGDQLLLACLPNEQHDIGLHLFSLVALDKNFRVLMLGSAIPLAELALVNTRQPCAAIILSGSHEQMIFTLRSDLQKLRSAVSQPIFIGGPAAKWQQMNWHSLDIIPLPQNLSQAIEYVQQQLTQ